MIRQKHKKMVFFFYVLDKKTKVVDFNSLKKKQYIQKTNFGEPSNERVPNMVDMQNQ